MDGACCVLRDPVRREGGSISWRARAIAHQTPSRSNGLINAFGQSFCNSWRTRAANLGCLSRILPARINCTGGVAVVVPWPCDPVVTLAAHVAASWARLLAAAARISVAILSFRRQAAST